MTGQSASAQPETGEAAGAGPRGLLEKLVGAVRAEFRDDVLTFAVDDPIFGGGACRISGCARSARGGYGMCQGHHQRWQRSGRPELENFVASTDAGWRRLRPNKVCSVEGCGYGSSRSGMCSVHAQRWHRAGQPDVAAWLIHQLPVTWPAPGSTCLIEHCVLWPDSTSAFCHSHHATWHVNGRPDSDEFVAAFAVTAVPADQIVRLGALSPQLKLEIQYVLQRRRDDAGTTCPPTVVMQAVRFLVESGEGSLLARTEQGWASSIGRSSTLFSNPRGLLVYGRRQVEDLTRIGGWDDEYDHDVWHLRRLGFAGNPTLRFDSISQSWLRDLVKKWVRWRLSTGLVLETVRRGLRSLTRFAVFCDRTGVNELADIDRDVLERYLADLHAELAGRQRHGDSIGQLASFLQTVRIHRWAPALPGTAMLFHEDYPKRPELLPRALSEHVMTQIEHVDSLDQWNNDAHRLVTVILIRCGLRVSDALRLPHDCVVLDADQAPYVRYFNHKMKREALVPIDEELHGLIRERQRTLTKTTLLFPRAMKNLDGTAPMSSSTYRLALYRWLERCQITDENHRPVRLTPHQWRHTLGTRLINKDVPQEVVRRILDHDSAQMTSHYARLHDTTVRRHWEAARKINISGETVVLDPDGAVADAAWAKQRIGRATQALPNGFCGLPVQKSCPHANACLTCPMFITTLEFLPQHRQQRTEVHQIISAAQARGQRRLIEMNQQVSDNLDVIITALEAGSNDPQKAANDI